MDNRKLTISELKIELAKYGITKGLSKLTKAQLEEALRRAISPHKIESDEDKKNLLRQITRKDLLKVISKIRITNYSHLKHDELIDLIVSKYWEDFHTRWTNVASNDINYALPYRPFGIKPTPGPKKPKVEPKKPKVEPKKPKVEPKKPKVEPKKPKVEPEEKKEMPVPLPTHTDIEKYLRGEVLKSQGMPVIYTAGRSTVPFYLLNVLQRNNNDCHIEKGGVFRLRATKKQIDKLDQDEINDIASSYLRCKRRGKMLVLYLSVNDRHANIMIFNYHRNEVERFEPHGKRTGIRGVDSDRIDSSIKKRLVDEVNKKLPVNEKLSYIPATKVCPTGFGNYQHYEQDVPKSKVFSKQLNIEISDPNGFCIAWSFFYADLRLKFPKIESSDLIKESFKVLSSDPERLRTFIRGQVQFLYDMMKEAVGSDEDIRRWFTINKKSKLLKSKLTIDEHELYLDTFEKWNIFFEKKFRQFTS